MWLSFCALQPVPLIFCLFFVSSTTVSCSTSLSMYSSAPLSCIFSPCSVLLSNSCNAVQTISSAWTFVALVSYCSPCINWTSSVDFPPALHTRSHPYHLLVYCPFIFIYKESSLTVTNDFYSATPTCLIALCDPRIRPHLATEDYSGSSRFAHGHSSQDYEFTSLPFAPLNQHYCLQSHLKICVPVQQESLLNFIHHCHPSI